MIFTIVDINYIYFNKSCFDRMFTKIGDGGIMVSESISVVGSDTELDTVATLKLVFTVGSDIESLSNKLPLFAESHLLLLKSLSNFTCLGSKTEV